MAWIHGKRKLTIVILQEQRRNSTTYISSRQRIKFETCNKVYDKFAKYLKIL